MRGTNQAVGVTTVEGPIQTPGGGSLQMMTVKNGSAWNKVIQRHQAVAETDGAPGGPDGL